MAMLTNESLKITIKFLLKMKSHSVSIFSGVNY